MTQSSHSVYPVSQDSGECCAQVGLCKWDKDIKQEMNADCGGGRSPCVLVLPVWGSAHKTESAGLSAWRQQKERPFLDMLSIGVLSLCAKSEFGAGKCSVQWPEQNEMG